MIAPIPINVNQSEEAVEEDSSSDSDQEADLPSLTPRRKRRVKTPHKIRRQPGRRSKQPVNYKGMFAMSNVEAEVNQDTTSNILDMVHSSAHWIFVEVVLHLHQLFML